MKVEESLNVTFDETPPPPKTSPLEDDELVEEEAIEDSKTKPIGNDLEDNQIVNIKESKTHPLENVIEANRTFTSTTKAEYVSARKACQQALWMKQALIDYGVRLDGIPIMCDNKRAIELRKDNGENIRRPLKRDHFSDETSQMFVTAETEGAVQQGPCQSDFKSSDYFKKDLLMQAQEVEHTRMKNSRCFLGRGTVTNVDDEMFTSSILEQNIADRVELEKVKQHYKELYDSIKIMRAHTSEKTSTMLNEIESLKAQLQSKEPCFTSDYVKPKVLDPGIYTLKERSWQDQFEQTISIDEIVKVFSDDACFQSFQHGRGYRIYNKRTRLINGNNHVHLRFDASSMAPVRVSSSPEASHRDTLVNSKQGRCPTDKEAGNVFQTITSLSTTIAQDAPSSSDSSSTLIINLPIQHQEIAEETSSRNTPINHLSHPSHNLVYMEIQNGLTGHTKETRSTAISTTEADTSPCPGSCAQILLDGDPSSKPQI
ncbi:hypothetical protein Tco_0878746 [Tanacetum coccineum]|uniref:Retrovirus-related Pol polyprotein from transposon TNT 1-94 n=1 Tax=Tanacetum coccineum TaxID=301880 RepID=A0ABQ5BYQ8_9ASTR